MLILGIDTSGKNATIAVYDSEKEIFLSETSIYTRLTHSQVIMPLCMDTLKKAEKSLNDIDVIAVANGPGSYTGLRIGISTVKAMAFGLGCKCVGVSTLDGLACNNIAFNGIICPVMKARENLVYTAVYSNHNGVINNIMSERIISSEELATFLISNNVPVLICGDYASEFVSEYNIFSIAPPHTRLQNACGVCLTALIREPSTPENLEVSYLQKVKAEKDLEVLGDAVPQPPASLLKKA